MNATEKLYEIVKDFPEQTMAKILDFAELLSGKRQSEKIEKANGDLLTELKGGLENSLALAGDPTKIQERLRNEWN